jgi:hypothetical protein
MRIAESAWTRFGNARRDRPCALEQRRLPDAILAENDGPLRGAVTMRQVQRLRWAEATNAGHAEAGEVHRAEAAMCFALFLDAAHAFTS